MPENAHHQLSPHERIHYAFSRMTRLWMYADVRRAVIGETIDFLDTNDFHMIDELYMSGTIRPSQLAQVFGMTPAAITKRVRHLHKHNVIDTLRDPNDGRATLIYLTSYGTELAEKIRDYTVQAFSTITHAWEPSKVEDFADYMDDYAQSAVDFARRSAAQ